MSLTVVFRETALRNLARIRGEDKDLFVRTRRPPPCWLISRIRRARSRGAPQASTGCMRAISGSCTRSMMRQQRCTSSTSGSWPESDRPRSPYNRQDISLFRRQGSCQGSSGLNAHWTLDAIAAEFAALRAAAGSTAEQVSAPARQCRPNVLKSRVHGVRTP